MVIQVRVCREIQQDDSSQQSLPDNILNVYNLNDESRQDIVAFINQLNEKNNSCIQVIAGREIFTNQDDECMPNTQNDNVLIVFSCDNVDREDILAHVNKMNEQMYRREEKILDEESSLIGSKYIVPAGLYCGQIIEDVYANFGMEGYLDILRASPRKNGSEDPDLHGAPITQVLPLIDEAWSYFFVYIYDNIQAKNDESELKILKNFLKIQDNDECSFEEIERLFCMRFAEVSIEYDTILTIAKRVIGIPGYDNKTYKQLYEEGGEKAFMKLLSEAVKATDVETFENGTAFLKEIHEFPAYTNLQEVAQLYRIPEDDPVKIAKIVSDRMNEKLRKLKECNK